METRNITTQSELDKLIEQCSMFNNIYYDNEMNRTDIDWQKEYVKMTTPKTRENGCYTITLKRIQYNSETPIISEKKPLTYSELKLDMEVMNEDGEVGIIRECDDIHNVLVEYVIGGTGLFCLDESCKENIYKIYKTK